MRRFKHLLFVGTVVAWISVVVRASGQGMPEEASADEVADLKGRLEAGAATLEADQPTGYLRSVLRALDINEDSQLLVFSKTSLDGPYVSPATPRAIYFNDTTAVAITPGAPEIEFASIDPRRGPQFYTLPVQAQNEPRIAGRRDCLGCHQGVTTPNVTSFVLMSLATAPDGRNFDFLPFEYVDQRTPIAFRWGGWYVTGTHGDERHRGNALTTEPRIDAEAPPEAQNVTSLRGRFDMSRYVTDTSDIVALMTFEHQIQMSNLTWATAQASRSPRASLGGASATISLTDAIERLVTYMTFADEAPIRDPIRGVSTFTQTFPKRGPRDAQGRSLRDFDLTRRVFRYPVSYLIYSRAFDALPDTVREAVYRRLYDVLTTPDLGPPFNRLTTADRSAAFEIVRDTKPGLPDYWRTRPRR